jgi:inner membrane protein COX18
MLLPAASQLPLFVGMTFVFNQACLPPTCLDMESFLFLSSLVHPDSTMALPIAIGLMTLANVETIKLFNMSEKARDQRAQTRKQEAEDEKKGIVRIGASDVSKNMLRFFSIGRILISIPLPGVRLFQF